MKLIYDGLSEEDGDGHIEFEWRGHHYHIGEIDNGDGFWFQRQLVTDYMSGQDNWEEATWHSVDKPPFKFLKK